MTIIDLKSPAVLARQKEVCQQYSSDVVLPDPHLKIGIAIDSLSNMPITGVRCTPENGTDGWYIWGGDHSSETEFYQPLHLSHIGEFAPQVVPYLALAPGFKFIIDNDGYEDVWFDPSLLEPS
ncbi:immunity protein Imm33 domain-containing protein [Massilia frigida]|uniref:immunity protein Imm33 domain-containing protein n=1 Tax=Massilia frigida TaxID=2609281 RepID=UPI001421A82A|nr:hypothetical protein [Massilia frigida]